LQWYYPDAIIPDKRVENYAIIPDNKVEF